MNFAAFAFDAYIAVDWSANNTPKRGENSIWYCVLERQAGKLEIVALENPPARLVAYRQLRETLLRLVARKQATLIGFDFPYGYPQGFAQALHLPASQPWKEVWELLARQMVDDEQNRSNRFEVAKQLNRTVSNAPFPFWGCPATQEHKHLTAKRRHRHSPDGLPEFRTTDQRQRGPQPVWKLCYPGSVGSQALLGIPYVAKLRWDPELAKCSRVRPFETGFTLAPRADRDWLLLHAEIYPSIQRVQPGPGECKDRAQVRSLAEYFARLDEARKLAELFAPPSALPPKQLESIIKEEGWILGVR